MTDSPKDGAAASSDVDLTQAASATAKPSISIGPYRLLERIGEGGMGEVWLAEQARPVHRQVALKVIKAGMDTAQVVARFDAERQALALMDHPAIARVFDGGATPQGRPYFVMEFVRGESITAYATHHKLALRARIELLMQVCEGVQHAHQKGIIHRDLKPSNILVTVRDDHPVPKIIDFGVAKAMTQSLTDRTLYTEVGALVGTPEYMSPEQAEIGGLDIDTRTDVYALGVILYELLTDTLPFDPKSLREKSLDEIRRVIRDVDPPRPSTRVTTLASSRSAGAQSIDVTRLGSQLRGDLDWITMKALEKDRTRRYGSVSDLAADLRRHLDDLPVLASPPSATYRIGKFVRRHRAGVAAVGTLITLLVVFAGAMVVQAGRIARERDRANQEAVRGNQEATTAKQVSDFLVGLFQVSEPGEARGNSITAREILEQGAAKIDGDLKTDPVVKARLMVTIGQVYWSLGLYARAEPLLQNALQVRLRVLGHDSLESLQSINKLGALLFAEGKLTESEALFREAVEGMRRTLGTDHADTLLSINNLGSTLNLQRKFSEAEPYLREALDIRRRTLGVDAPATLSSINNLGALLQMQGKQSEAEHYYREGLATSRRVRGNDHPSTLLLLHNLAELLELQGKNTEGTKVCREALDGRRRVLGPDHPATLRTAALFGNLLRRAGQLAEADEELRRVLDRQRHILPSRHQDTATTLIALARVRHLAHRNGEAESLAREGLQMFQALRDNYADEIASAMGVLGESLVGQRRLQEAESVLVRSYERVASSEGTSALEKREAIERVLTLYEVWAQPRKIVEWQLKLRGAPSGVAGAGGHP